MYEVMKDGIVFAMTDCPHWIHMQSNGCYGLTDPDTATGIVVDGSVYHLSGTENLPGSLGDVMVLKVDPGPCILGNQNEQALMEEAMCETDMQNSQLMAELEAAICEMDMGGNQ